MARAIVWRCCAYESATRLTSKQANTRIADMKQTLSLPSQLGPILRGARKAASLSQADLAARVGLSQKRVSSLELDPSSMTVAQLLTITAVLRVEVMLQPYGTEVPTGEW